MNILCRLRFDPSNFQSDKEGREQEQEHPQFQDLPSSTFAFPPQLELDIILTTTNLAGETTTVTSLQSNLTLSSTSNTALAPDPTADRSSSLSSHLTSNSLPVDFSNFSTNRRKESRANILKHSSVDNYDHSISKTLQMAAGSPQRSLSPVPGPLDEDGPVNRKEVIQGQVYEVALFIEGRAAGRHQSEMSIRCTPNPLKYRGDPYNWEVWQVSVVNEKEQATALQPGAISHQHIPIKKWVVARFRARRTGIARLSDNHKKAENWYLNRWSVADDHDFELQLCIDKIPVAKVKQLYATFRVHLAWKKDKDRTPTSPEVFEQMPPIPPGPDPSDSWEVLNHTSPLYNGNGVSCFEITSISTTPPNFIATTPLPPSNPLKIEMVDGVLSTHHSSPVSSPAYPHLQSPPIPHNNFGQLLPQMQPSYSFYEQQQHYQQFQQLQHQQYYAAQPYLFDPIPKQEPIQQDNSLGIQWQLDPNDFFVGILAPEEYTHEGMDFTSAPLSWSTQELYQEFLATETEFDAREREMLENEAAIDLMLLGRLDEPSDSDILNFINSVFEKQPGKDYHKRIVLGIPDVKGHGEVLVKIARAAIERLSIRPHISIWNIVIPTTNREDQSKTIHESEDAVSSDESFDSVSLKDLVNSVLSFALLAKKQPQNKYILQLSWTTTKEFKVLERAIVLAQKHGVLVVVAAGNRGIDLSVHPQSGPSQSRQVLTTGALNHDRYPWHRSNYRSSPHDDFPFVWAPGSIQQEKSDPVYGTSIASTFVSVDAGFKMLTCSEEGTTTSSTSPPSTWKQVLRLIVQENERLYPWYQVLKPIPLLSESLPSGSIVIWVDTGNPFQFLSVLPTHCCKHSLPLPTLYRFRNSLSARAFINQRRKELFQRLQENSLRIVSNRQRGEEEGGAFAGRDFYEAMRREGDFRNVPFLIFCGRPDEAGIATDAERRIWVTRNISFALDFVAMCPLPVKVFRGPILVANVVKCANLVNKKPPSSIPHPLAQAITNTKGFYVRLSFSDNECISTPVIDAVNEHNWNFIHTKPLEQLVPSSTSTPDSPRNVSTSSMSTSTSSSPAPLTSSSSGSLSTYSSVPVGGAICQPTLVNIEVMSRDTIPLPVFSINLRDKVIGAASIDFGNLQDKKIYHLWLTLQQPDADSSGGELPKVLVKLMRLSNASQVMDRSEFEDPSPIHVAHRLPTKEENN